VWSRLAQLPLVIEDYALERLERPPAFGHDRGTDLVRLRGGGEEGLGEDITVYLPEGTAAPALELSGEWTLGSFCEHLAAIEQWTEPPEWDLARAWRNWGYESAALDLALLQAGQALHEVVGLAAAPVRFVNSFGLGDPPQFAMLQRRLERYPQPALQARRPADVGPDAARADRRHRRGRDDRLQGPVRARGQGARGARAAV